MQKPKLLLFDIGGIFIEYKDVFRTVKKEQNINIKLLDQTFDKYDEQITKGKIDSKDLWELFINENNVTVDINYNLLKSWVSDYYRIEPTFKFFELVKSKYEIGLLSNIYKDFVPQMIKQNFLPNYDYKYKFLSCDIGMQKPDEEIYKYVQQNVNVKPKEIFYLDDKKENLVVPNKLGWQTFHFQRYEAQESVEKLQKILMNF